jgi:hypothetical protein
MFSCCNEVKRIGKEAVMAQVEIVYQNLPEELKKTMV